MDPSRIRAVDRVLPVHGGEEKGGSRWAQDADRADAASPGVPQTSLSHTHSLCLAPLLAVRWPRARRSHNIVSVLVVSFSTFCVWVRWCAGVCSRGPAAAGAQECF